MSYDEDMFRKDERDEWRFNYGRHRNERAVDYPDYLKWMIKDGMFNNFSLDVAQEVLEELGES